MAMFTGAGVAIATPFTQDGIDFTAFERLIEFQIENGTDAIIACGTTGEPSTMSEDEQKSVIKFVIKRVNGRIPVIASTGGNNTAECIARSQAAQAAGADGLMLVTPYYNKATQGGLVAHYTAVANAVDLPILIYNVPSRTGLNMLPATLAELAQHRNIAAMKEASGNIAQVAEMKRLCGDAIDMYSGEDGIILPVISLGGLGVISVAANIIPKQVHDLCAAALQGDYAKARELQFAINPLVDMLFAEVNPIPVKAALYKMGMIDELLRLPLTPMTDSARAKLYTEMAKFGL